MHKGINTYPQPPIQNHHDIAPQHQLPPLHQISQLHLLHHDPHHPSLSSLSYVPLKQLAQFILSWLQAVDAEFAACQHAALHCITPPICSNHPSNSPPESPKQIHHPPAHTPQSNPAPAVLFPQQSHSASQRKCEYRPSNLTNHSASQNDCERRPSNSTRQPDLVTTQPPTNPPAHAHLAHHTNPSTATLPSPSLFSVPTQEANWPDSPTRPNSPPPESTKETHSALAHHFQSNPAPSVLSLQQSHTTLPPPPLHGVPTQETTHWSDSPTKQLRELTQLTPLPLVQTHSTAPPAAPTPSPTQHTPQQQNLQYPLSPGQHHPPTWSPPPYYPFLHSTNCLLENTTNTLSRLQIASLQQLQTAFNSVSCPLCSSLSSSLPLSASPSTTPLPLQETPWNPLSTPKQKPTPLPTSPPLPPPQFPTPHWQTTPILQQLDKTFHPHNKFTATSPTSTVYTQANKLTTRGATQPPFSSILVIPCYLQPWLLCTISRSNLEKYTTLSCFPGQVSLYQRFRP